MASMGYNDLLRRAKRGRCPQPATSQTVIVPSLGDGGADAGGEGSSLAARSVGKKKDRPRPSVGPSGKDGEVDRPSKRMRGGKGKDPQRKSSSPIDLDHLTEADFDRFRTDPLLFMADVAKAGSRLIAQLKQGEADRTAGKRLLAQNLWLESDNLDKTDKLNSAYTYISALREELESVKQKLQESESALKPTAEALDEANKSLTVVTKERDDALVAIAEAERKAQSETTKNNELSDRVKELEEEVDGLKKNLGDMERERDEALDETDRLVDSTLAICRERFEEALAQVQCVYPNLEIDPNIINHAHSLRGDCIVYPAERGDQGEIIREERIVFERPM